MIKLPIT